jgi:anthranilate phosphoribosyltransferase
MLAEALRALGSERALVVHGSDGLDEISISAESKVTELINGELRTYTVTPEDFGFRRAPLEAIRGGDARQNSAMILEVLNGVRSPRRDIVLLNAAAALVASSRVSDFTEGVRLAAEAIDSGKAKAKLERLIEFTNQV